MNEDIVQEIVAELRIRNISHGSANIELVYHDGRVTYYIITTSVRKNVNKEIRRKQ